MNDQSRCSRCGASFDPPGPCPACLLSAAMVRPRAPDLAGTQLGPYTIGRLLGQGGMGVVYEALDTRPTSPRFNLMVALKILTADAPELLVREAQLLAALEHEHIVRVYEVGEHDGIFYFTMQLGDGSLMTPASSPERAAKITWEIARAVDFAHRRGILHRDLKPGNVLIDAAGKPFVTDFGIAEREGIATRAGGTPEYMAPEVLEQLPTPVSGTAKTYTAPEVLSGKRSEMSIAADVWGVGALLYELLAGHPPFQSDSLAKLQRKVKEEPPPPLVGIDEDLAAVCLHCLEKNPSHRYETAGQLADDLDRFLKDDPVFARPPRTLTGHAWQWCLRHPLSAGLILALMTFLVIMTPNAVSLVRAQNAVKRAQITQVNMNSAAMVAGTVLSQLRALSDAVERVATEPELARALENGDGAALQAFLMSANRFYEQPPHGLKLNGRSPFDVWCVFDEKGVARAIVGDRSLAANPILVRNTVGKDYSWRNYFKGAWHLAGKGLASTYVSSAFMGEAVGTYKFNIAAPIFGRNRRPIGVLTAAVATAANLGSLVVRDGQSIAVLVAPRDRERDTPEPASTHLILLHPAYTYGEAIPSENEHVQKLDRASRDASLRIERPLGLPPPDLVTWSDDYRDPVATKYPQYAGRWLAGFAPVGNTGFVVIVQTREEEALGSEKQLGWQVAKWAGISMSPGVLFVLLAAWYKRRRAARRARARP